MNMKPEMLRLMMDMLGLNDRKVATSLGVTHPTVIRWRTGRTDIPLCASLAMDCVYGHGSDGSAESLTCELLENRWKEFVEKLGVKKLCSIAEGYMAVAYEDGNFYVTPYTEDLASGQVYVGDVCGVSDYPNEWKDKIFCKIFDSEPLPLIDALSSAKNDEDKEIILALISLVGEATRSDLLLYDVKSNVLQEIYEQFQRSIDADE